MKYEAKNDGSGNAVSTAAGTPYVNISQTDAITKSQNVAGCTGCHLITEAEWMTLAQNVLSVASNWSGGAVGSGYIYSGHNDNAPSSALAADASDANGYTGTLNSSGDATITNGMAGNTQKRTLTLTNGQVIWDMSGNVWEWTSGQTSGNQPGIATTGLQWTEWPSLTVPGNLAVNPTPAGTGLAGANIWDKGNGMGVVWSNTDETALHGFFRGGDWNSNSGASALTLNLGFAPSHLGDRVGFRVAR